MVGPKRKKKNDKQAPKLKIGGIYHSDLYTGEDRRGHFVIVADIISSEKVKVHICTSSDKFAGKALEAYGLFGPEITYIIKIPETVDPVHIKQSKHMAVPGDIASELGIII